MFTLFKLMSLASLAAIASAETHTIVLVNNCGFGTPTLLLPGNDLVSTGAPFTVNGPIRGAIAYLQTGGCGENGEGCTLVEATLLDGGSAADISLIPPHAFSVTSGFGFFDGCDGAGTDCTNSGCPMAFRQPDDTFAIVGCGAPSVNLAITFCD
ncbi:hypothetical protein PUNSTDRAFT_128546 [Punctularia strigosozonata HHB-11173 SS5]|uniref:Glycopeptide n=1 Tax=Punctularia strigosozonata (strain HHB-11173) TaxID=741275 RepID=R7S2J3_PUNST|nr:uncharacterized protein PUNSTDRAFT_128546 [Punctularia strigosozonata HHB-11173 SS5]EIN04002.1 hypothetical protein PUNSTDRAFT_128546 [Punctularia strigosozonata HHB-11173 SS5]